MLLQDSETTYYPTTLPLRKPNSGDPGSLFNGTFNNLNLVIHRSYDFCISKNVMMIFILISTLSVYRLLVFLLEVLNENEFGEDAEKEYDESTINHAAELGLLVGIRLVVLMINISSLKS